MFGYVTADFTSLSKPAKKRYRAVYCGLCHTLSKKYGALSRHLLSFDLTFLALVLAKDMKTVPCRCLYRLGKKQGCVCSAETDYAADLTLILTCLKFDDDIKDERSIKARLLKKLFTKQYEKAKANNRELYESVKALLFELAESEKRGEQNPDIPADIFGRLMERIFTYRGSDRFSEFGYFLGRFIYLCDAVCDFKSDIMHGRYNPLVCMRKSDFEPMLAFNVEKCIDIMAQLEIRDEIIENVLNRGIWLRYAIKYKRKV